MKTTLQTLLIVSAVTMAIRNTKDKHEELL